MVNKKIIWIVGITLLVILMQGKKEMKKEGMYDKYDVNCDGYVNYNDLDYISACLGDVTVGCEKCDLNNDNSINIFDFILMNNELGTRGIPEDPYDVNNDDYVNNDDLDYISACLGDVTVGCEKCDLNNDNSINIFDFILMNNELGTRSFGCGSYQSFLYGKDSYIIDSLSFGDFISNANSWIGG